MFARESMLNARIAICNRFPILENVMHLYFLAASKLTQSLTCDLSVTLLYGRSGEAKGRRNKRKPLKKLRST